MASMTLQDGRTISFPDGLQPDQVKKIVAAAQAPMPWSDVPGQYLKNLPASAMKFGKSVVEQIRHPLQTYEGLGQGVRAMTDLSRESMFPGMSKLTGKAPAPETQEISQSLKDRYVGEENIKRTIATDPFGATVEALSVLAGGSAAIPRLAGRATMPAIPRPPGQTRASMALLRNAAPKDAKAFAGLGDEAMLLDASPSMTGLAQGVAPLPGKSRNSIVEELFARQQGRSKRLVADTTATLGKARDPGMLKDTILAATKRKTDPMYARAIENAPQLPKSLDDLLAGGVERSLEGLSLNRRYAKIEIYDRLDDALRAETPSQTASRLWDIRQELDSQISYDKTVLDNLSSADRSMQSVLKDVRHQVDDILKNRIPGFREADALMSNAKNSQRAVDYGRDSLDGGKYAVTPERMTLDLNKLPKRFVGEGQKADIRTAMGTQANDLAALRKKVGGDYDFNREKLAKVFGQDKVDSLIKSIDREERFGQSYADITRNSQTAQRLEGSKSVSAPDAPRFSGQETVLGMSIKGTAKLLNAVVAKTIGKAHKPTADALTKALIAKGPEARQLLGALMTGDARSRAKILTALLSEQSAVNALQYSHR